jgi:ADP-ribose pyrophosphatase YjhB (NUDIX family)
MAPLLSRPVSWVCSLGRYHVSVCQACGPGEVAGSAFTSTARLCGPSLAPAILRRVPSFYRDPEAPAPNNPRRVGVVAFIVRDGALLLERRADFGTWGIPGGALEEDETVDEAISREVHEETGLEVVAADLFGVFSDPSRIISYPDGNVFRLLTVAFVVQVAIGEPRISDESLELRFVPLGEIRRFEIGPAHAPLIDAYLSSDVRPIIA